MTTVVLPVRTPAHRAPRDPRSGVAPLTLGAAASVLLAGLAVTASRGGWYEAGVLTFFLAVLTPFAAGVSVLLRSEVSSRVRRWAVLTVGLLPTVVYRLTDPLLLTGFDEQLHLRTLVDLVQGAPLFSPNPLLAASPRFPGLELLTLAVHRASGLPLMAAVTLVVLLCRLILVLALFRLAEHVTGDERAGALAVGVYAASPQFYFFNSQFAYQTLALSLAVSGGYLLARATRSARPWMPVLGAVVCLAATAITHHLTSWITAGALLVWTATAGRRDRRLVGIGALAAVAAVVAQAVPIAGQLSGYLGPMVDSAVAQAGALFGGSSQRTLFADSAGASTPVWERLVLVAYAVLITVAAVVIALALFRHARRRGDAQLFVLGLLALLPPASFAGRFAPQISEMCDRATTFTFIPFAIAAAWVFRHGRLSAPGGAAGRTHATLTRTGVTLLLTCLGYLGGLILGSGPDWGRLPGSFLVVADSRSLDAETLAAARWSADHLAPGSTIMADRMPATLFAATGRLWVDVAPRAGLEPATFYFSETWGAEQTRTARAMGLRYLYVDTRLAESLPHQQWYFYAGETPQQRQLTASALTKFDGVDGIRAAYRHGPVSIYDLAGLGVVSQTRGWTGSADPHPWRDLFLGAALLLLLRWRAVPAMARELGPAGSLAVATALVALGAGAAVAVGFRPGWWLTVGLLPALLLIPVSRPARRPRPAAHPSIVVTAVLAALIAAGGVALSVRSAWSVDVTRVDRIIAAVRESG